MKTKRIMVVLLILCFALSVFPPIKTLSVASGNKVLTQEVTSWNINGKTIPKPGRETGTWYGQGECWAFAQEIYGYLWNGAYFTSYRGTDDDMLRNLTDGERRITANNARNFVLAALPGSVIRVMEYTYSHDGQVNGKYGHSMILLSKDRTGMYIYDDWDGYVRIKYFTYEGFASAMSSYVYFKYIKYPSATAFAHNMPSQPILMITPGTSDTYTIFSWFSCANTDHYDLRIKYLDGTLYKIVYGLTDTEYSIVLPADTYMGNICSCYSAEGPYVWCDDITFTVKQGSTTAPMPTHQPTSTPTQQPTATPTATLTPTQEPTPSTVPQISVGDINYDGKINTADAVLVLKEAAGMINLTTEQLRYGDCNHDGKVNTADAVLILKYAAGMITTF